MNHDVWVTQLGSGKHRRTKHCNLSLTAAQAICRRNNAFAYVQHGDGVWHYYTKEQEQMETQSPALKPGQKIWDVYDDKTGFLVDQWILTEDEIQHYNDQNPDHNYHFHEVKAA